ncbi:TPA: YadA-like family protein [Mannheimia haemolytica]
MNKIFKVIWSKTTNELVVVSELASSRGKAKSSVSNESSSEATAASFFSNVFKLSAITALLFSTIPSVAEAAVAISHNPVSPTSGTTVYTTTGTANGNGATAVGTRSIAIGENAGKQRPDGDRASEGDNNTDHTDNDYQKISTKYLSETTREGNNLISIGSRAFAGGHDSIAIGTNSQAVWENNYDKSDANPAYNSKRSNNGSAVAIGFQSFARGDQSIALGSRAEARNRQTVALGNDSFASGVGSVVVGGDDSSYIGGSTFLKDPNDLGGYSTPTRVDYDAQGNQILTTTPIGFTPNSYNRTLYRPSVASGNGAVVVGVHSQSLSKGSTAVGVAATAGDGGLNSNDRDDTVAGGIKGIDPTKNIEATAVGALSNARSQHTTAVGYASKAFGKESTVLGAMSEAHTDKTMALGYKAKVQSGSTSSMAIGENAEVKPQSTNSIAMGANTTVKGNYVVAIGDDVDIETPEQRGSIAIGNQAGKQGLLNYGVTNTNVGSTGYKQQTVTNRSGVQQDTITIGTNSFTSGHDSIAIGTRAQAIFDQSNLDPNTNSRNSLNSAALAIGYQALSRGDQAVSLGSRAEATNRQAVAIGNDSTASGVGAVVIGGDDSSYIAGTNGINNTNGGYSIDFGYSKGQFRDAAATGNGAIAVGTHAQALSKGSAALGVGATAGDNGEEFPTDKTQTTAIEATAVGALARAKSLQSTAVGHLAQADEKYTTVVGDNAKAQSVASVSIGRAATVEAKGTRGIAIGSFSDDTINDNSKVTKVSGVDSVAIGTGSQVSGETSAAIGTGNTITTDKTFAVGNNITTTAKNSVFLGDNAAYVAKGASTDGIGAVTEPVTVNGVTYGSFAGKTPVGVVSVGSAGSERRIQNVAAGLISATSTDAINGSQLYQTQQVLGNVASTTATNLGGGSTVGADGQLTAPTYNVVKGNTNPAQAGNSNQNFTTTPAKNVGDALTNLNTYINQGFNVQDDAGATKGVVTPGESVKFANGNATTATVETEVGGVTTVKYDVKVDGTTITVQGGKLTATAKAPETTALTVNEGKVTTPADGEGNKLVNATNIANAINSSGFNLKTSAVKNQGQKLAGTADNGELINPADTVEMIAGKNLTVKQDKDGKITIATADNVVTTETDKYVTGGNAEYNDKGEATTTLTGVNGAGGTVTGIKNYYVTSAATQTDGKKATLTRNDGGKVDIDLTKTVQAAVDEATEKGTKYAGDKAETTGGKNEFSRKLGETTNVLGGAKGELSDGNIGVVSNGTDTLTVKLAKELTGLTSAEFKDTAGNTTTIGGNGITIDPKADGKPNVTLTANGLDNGGNQIKNVAEGTNGTDAVNVNQLRTEVAASKENVVSSDGSIKVDSRVRNDYSTEFDVTVNVDGTTITKGENGELKANTTNLTIEGATDEQPEGTGKVATPATGTALVTASTVADAINKSGFTLTTSANGGEKDTASTGSEVINPGEKIDMAAGKNLVVKQDANGKVTYSTKDDIQLGAKGEPGKDGVDGKLGVNGKDGSAVVLNGKDGSIGLNGKDGENGLTFKSDKGADGVDGKNGTDGKTRIVYTPVDKEGNPVIDPATNKPVVEEVATLNDGLIFTGNNNDVLNRHKLNTVVNIVGEGVSAADAKHFESATGNINVKANGSDTLEIQLSKDIDLTQDGSVKTGDTTVDNNGLTIKGGPSVTKAGVDAGGKKVTNVADGEISSTSKDAVNGSQLHNAIQNAGWDLTVDGNVAENTGSTRVANNGKATIKGGKNIVVSRKDSTVEIATSSTPEFDSVKVGGTTISSTVAKDGVNELNVAGNNGAPTRITNVAAGVKDNDAVNVGQLKGAVGALNNKINRNNRDLRAGIAGANAAAGLPQVYIPGKSMLAASAGTFKGENALAVGYSRSSDNGKLILKLQGNANSRGDVGGSMGVGYQW